MERAYITQEEHERQMQALEARMRAERQEQFIAVRDVVEDVVDDTDQVRRIVDRIDNIVVRDPNSHNVRIARNEDAIQRQGVEREPSTGRFIVTQFFEASTAGQIAFICFVIVLGILLYFGGPDALRALFNIEP